MLGASFCLGCPLVVHPRIILRVPTDNAILVRRGACAVETVVRIFWVRIFLVAPEVMHESGYAQQVGDLEGGPKVNT
jgi:hypothetical protein